MAMNLVAWGTAWDDDTWEDDPPAWELGEEETNPPQDTGDDSWIVIGRRRGRR